MTTDTTIQPHSDICIGELIWPAHPQPNHAEQQQRDLASLSESARMGIILDCSRVEIGNSEIVNVLMRVRNHAKKGKREIVLFNVPETLSETLQLCNLQSVVRSTDDAAMAKKLVCDLAKGKGSARLWIESHTVLAMLAAICICGVAGLALYSLAG